MAQFTEEEKTIRRIDKRFNKGVVQYGLIEEGDKILIGLSGGKDSLALVELLGKRARIYKPRFSVVAVHVVMRNIPYQSDTEYLKAHCEACGVPFLQYETSFDPSTDTRKSIPVTIVLKKFDVLKNWVCNFIIFFNSGVPSPYILRN